MAISAPLLHSQRVAPSPLPNFDRRIERAALPPPLASVAAAAPREKAAQILKERIREVRIDSDPVTRSPKWVGSTEGFLTGANGDGGALVAPAHDRRGLAAHV